VDVGDKTNDNQRKAAPFVEDTRSLIADCRQTVQAFRQQRDGILALSLAFQEGVSSPVARQRQKRRTNAVAYAFKDGGNVLYRSELTVLVVDDNAGSRYAISRSLEAAGYRTVQAAGGSEALERAADVDAVILDVHLPDIDGLEVCHRLRRTGSKVLPIIQVSAVYTEREHRGNGAAAGADEYIVAPVDPELLVETLDSLIAKYRAKVR
jgi:CheY-like chemotaxis protein